MATKYLQHWARASWTPLLYLAIGIPIGLVGLHVIEDRTFILYAILGNQDSVLYDRNLLQLLSVVVLIPFAAAWTIGMVLAFRFAAKKLGIRRRLY